MNPGHDPIGHKFTTVLSGLIALQLVLFLFSWLTTLPSFSGIASNLLLNSIVIILDLLLIPVCVVLLTFARKEASRAKWIVGVIGACAFLMELAFVLVVYSLNN